jgi:cytochrome c2
MTRRADRPHRPALASGSAGASRFARACCVAVAALGAAGLAGCDALLGWVSNPPPATAVPGGDGERGRLLLRQFGCGACHRIPGVAAAEGNVGPPLGRLHERVYLAGVIANTPSNLVRWIVDPQRVDPLTAMPDLGVTEPQARDMAAYLLEEE